MVTFRYSTWPPLPLALRQVSTTSLMCSPSAAALTSFGLDLSACLEKLMSLTSALPVPPPPPRPPPPTLVTPHEQLSIPSSPLFFPSRDSPSLPSTFLWVDRKRVVVGKRGSVA